MLLWRIRLRRSQRYHITRPDIDFASSSKQGQLPLPISKSNSDRPQTPPNFWQPDIVELEENDPRNIIHTAPPFKKRSRFKKVVEKEKIEDDEQGKEPFHPEITFASCSKD